MIDLKVNNTKCELKASGSSGKLGIEILLATHTDGGACRKFRNEL